MALVYLHKRKSDKVIFYVGISKGKKRPYSAVGRNYDWRKEVETHGGFDVEIVAENVSYEDAKSIEIKLISEYGRKNKGLGSLVNWTDGGDGSHGFKRSDEMNNKQSESMKKISSRYKTQEFKTKMSLVTSGEKNGMYNKKHSEDTKAKMKDSWTEERRLHYKEINYGDKNPMFGKKNYIRSNANKLQTLGQNPRARAVLQFDLVGNLIKEYSCIKEAELMTKVSHIGEILKGRRKYPKKCNYKFKYKNDE